MPSKNQSGSDDPYDGDTDLRILHEGNDLQVRALVEGLTGNPNRRDENMERAQKLIKQESMNQGRDWVVRKLKSKIKEIAEAQE